MYGKKTMMKKGGKKKFPDLTGDGKVTRADILKGRGVIKRDGGKLEGSEKNFAGVAERARAAARNKAKVGKKK